MSVAKNAWWRPESRGQCFCHSCAGPIGRIFSVCGGSRLAKRASGSAGTPTAISLTYRGLKRMPLGHSAGYHSNACDAAPLRRHNWVDPEARGSGRAANGVKARAGAHRVNGRTFRDSSEGRSGPCRRATSLQDRIERGLQEILKRPPLRHSLDSSALSGDPSAGNVARRGSPLDFGRRRLSSCTRTPINWCGLSKSSRISRCENLASDWGFGSACRPCRWRCDT